MTTTLVHKSVEEMAELIKNKELSPVDLFEAHINRIEETEDKINAYISIYKEEGLKEAKKAEDEIQKGNYKGIYHGIPMAIKDNIFTKDRLTTMASKIHQDFVPSYDAKVVEKLKEAGIVQLGKLNMHEYALSITSNNPYYGAVHNPWNTDKIPGGSSGGSAAAVAVGSSAASVGTDTAGSIRIPASACGIVGLKPTRSLVSTHGVYPLSWTLDHVGPMTKTVRDAAAMMDIISEKSGEGYLKAIDGNVKGKVIGIDESYFFRGVDEPIEKAFLESLRLLERQGAILKEVKFDSFEGREDAVFMFSVCEASAVHYDAILERVEDFGADIRGFLQMGAFPGSPDYARVSLARKKIMADFDELYKEIDILASPTLPIFPNNIGEDMAELNGESVELLPNFIRMTGPANLAGLPALSVPCGLHNGLPIGMQFIGKAYSEKTVLNMGYALERENLMQGKRPEL